VFALDTDCVSTKDQKLSAALHGEALFTAQRPELQALIDHLREVAEGHPFPLAPSGLDHRPAACEVCVYGLPSGYRRYSTATRRTKGATDDLYLYQHGSGDDRDCLRGAHAITEVLAHPQTSRQSAYLAASPRPRQHSSNVSATFDIGR
jgi:hypothetical protein